MSAFIIGCIVQDTIYHAKHFWAFQADYINYLKSVDQIL